MTAYSYRQNNSGGFFTDPAKYVIVIATSVSHSQEIACQAGVYFNGVAAGRDCGCCGDRWYPVPDEHETVECAVVIAIDHAYDGDKHIKTHIVVDDLDVADTNIE